MKKYIRLLFISFCYLIVFFTLLACKKPNMNTIKPVENINEKSYLAIGDSYTIGESVAVSKRFPIQTATLLKDSMWQIKSPQIIAQTGWTTSDLLAALQRENSPQNFDLVTLLIGVNNQYQGGAIDVYRNEFTTLLVKAIQYARNNKDHVVVLSIPDYSVMPFSANLNKEKIAQEIDAFNAVNKDVTQQMGVTYLDITAISREATINAALIADDGLHPSGEQYARWAALLAPILKAKL